LSWPFSLAISIARRSDKASASSGKAKPTIGSLAAAMQDQLLSRRTAPIAMHWWSGKRAASTFTSTSPGGGGVHHRGFLDSRLVPGLGLKQWCTIIWIYAIIFALKFWGWGSDWSFLASFSGIPDMPTPNS
jgi:hypothetical protein